MDNPTVHSLSRSISLWSKMTDQGFADPIHHTNPRLVRKHWADWLNQLCETKAAHSTCHRWSASNIFHMSFSHILDPTHWMLGKLDVRFLPNWAPSRLRFDSTVLQFCCRAFRSMPFCFITRTDKRPRFLPSFCVVSDLLQSSEKHLLEFAFTLRPIDVLEHRHVDDPIFEFFCSDSACCHFYLNLFEKFHCAVPRENIPLELKWRSIDAR